MQKLSIEVLEKMMGADLSKNEIDVLLYIARYQDDTGHIIGVHYKDVCDAIGISFQGYYDVLEALERKEIISCEKKSYYDKDITILDNNFAGKENYGRGYVSLHCGMVRSQEWQKLKGGAKLLALHLMREWRIYKKHAKSESYKEGKEKLLKKYQDLMHRKKRTIRAYLGLLKPFLNLYLEDGSMYYITFRKAAVDDPIGSDSENDEWRMHNINISLRRNRIKEAESEQIRDVKNTLSQYHKEIKKGGIDLSQIIKQTIEVTNAGRKNAAKWKRNLSPSFIHRLLRLELGYPPRVAEA